jgi:hypothetical protein
MSQIISPSQFGQSYVKDLRENTFAIDNALSIGLNQDNSIEEYVRFYLNIFFVIVLNPAVQDIAANSIAPIYFALRYFIFSGQYAGQWKIGVRPAITPPFPDLAFDELDDRLHVALPLIASGNQMVHNILNFSLQGLKCRQDLTGIEFEDASFLMRQPGVLFVAPYFKPTDSRKVLGSGVTDTDIYDLKAFTNCTVVPLPKYVS